MLLSLDDFFYVLQLSRGKAGIISAKGLPQAAEHRTGTYL